MTDNEYEIGRPGLLYLIIYLISRFTSTPSDSPDGKSRTDDSVGSAIGGGRFRTKLEKYLRRNGTLTAGILNRFKGRSTARPSSSDVASGELS